MSQKRSILLGAILAGGLASSFYLFSKRKDKSKEIQKSNTVSKELAIRILKEIQVEMFSVLTNIAMIANQLKDQTRGRLSNQEIKEFLLSSSTQTKEQIKSISDSVYQKYGLEEKDIRYACEITFKDDNEIINLLNDSKNMFDKAFMGIAPDVKTDIPEFLTPEVTLRIMKKLMKESLFKIHDFLNDLSQKGVKISKEDPQVLKGLRELKIADIRKQILIKEGLDKYQDPPLKIFQFATQKYSTEDPDNFNQKLIKLEMQNQKAMEALMNNSHDAFVAIEAIGAHLATDSKELMESHLKNKRIHQGESQKKGEESIKENEELETLNHIKMDRLQNQISSELKNALEENAFPQEIVNSAVKSLFDIFGNLNQSFTSSDRKINESLKKPEIELNGNKSEDQQKNLLSHSSDEKQSS